MDPGVRRRDDLFPVHDPRLPIPYSLLPVAFGPWAD